ncbi:hypothetical protein GQ56_0104645 [Burkholderia paludis]|nr:hypothetical protein GQ56_0104645 [Burkholderia paludis]
MAAHALRNASIRALIRLYPSAARSDARAAAETGCTVDACPVPVAVAVAVAVDGVAQAEPDTQTDRDWVDTG